MSGWLAELLVRSWAVVTSSAHEIVAIELAIAAGIVTSLAILYRQVIRPLWRAGVKVANTVDEVLIHTRATHERLGNLEAAEHTKDRRLGNIEQRLDDGDARMGRMEGIIELVASEDRRRIATLVESQLKGAQLPPQRRNPFPDAGRPTDPGESPA